jgi:predicted deacylase
MRCRLAGLALAVALGLPPPALAQEPVEGEALEEPWGPIEVLGTRVEPGESGRAVWGVSESFAGVSLDAPVFVLRGVRPGPTLCLTAGVHGDELNGIELVRRSIDRVKPQELHGTLIGVPIVNLHGFRRSSRYLPDRRDLNRYFPGRPRGSSASRIAYDFFENVMRRCSLLIDMHTGSFHRANLPQVRANLELSRVSELALAFGTTIVVHSLGTPGTLRRAAVEAGIAAITYEAGEPMRFQVPEVERGARGVRNVLAANGMLRRRASGRQPEIYHRTRWVRVDDGGILIGKVELGQQVAPGEVLGSVTDPVSNERAELRSPFAGTLIGVAVNQVVIPGFAAFHLGLSDDAQSLPPAEEAWEPEDVELPDYDGEERPEE